MAIDKEPMRRVVYVGASFDSIGRISHRHEWFRNSTEVKDRKGFDKWLNDVTGRPIHHLRIGNQDVRASDTGFVIGKDLYIYYKPIDFARLSPTDFLARTSSMKQILPLLRKADRLVDVGDLLASIYWESNAYVSRHTKTKFPQGISTELVDRLSREYEVILQEAKACCPLIDYSFQKSEPEVSVKTPSLTGSTERVPFRLLQTPCCGTLLCWVNPRLPAYCPECGKFIYPEIKNGVLQRDDDAILKIRI